jgi:uncharacterized protein DUF6600
MKRWMIQGAVALLLAGSMTGRAARADQNYYDDDPYGYYDDGSSQSDGSGYDNGSGYDDADVYYENNYGADNAYDLYFYRSLGSYGEWVYLPGIGYVWRPFVVSGWQPYSVGYWGWYHDCWSWVSYEPFGAIAYHYGNWSYMDDYGWCWFPGYRWAPHHVTWSSWNGYVGWSPTPPRIYGGSGYRFNHGERHFVWVPNRQFLSHDVSRFTVRSSQIWRDGREPRSIPILSSPTRSVAERWTGRAVDQIELRSVNRSTRRGVVQVLVPDQQTSERIRLEGRDVIRPWLDTKRLPEGRPVRPWQRRGSDGSNSPRVRPGQRPSREPEVRVERPERWIPRERQGNDDTRSSERDRQQGEPRRATPWRRYKPDKDPDASRSDDRRGGETRERGGDDRRGGETRERGGDDRRGGETRERGGKDNQSHGSSDDRSGDSNRSGHGYRHRDSDNGDNKAGHVESKPQKRSGRGKNN